MPNEQVRGGQLGLASVALAQIETRVLPGVRGKTTRDILVQNSNNQPIPIKKGTQIIIQPLDAEKGTFRLTTFKRDPNPSNPDLPESQRDIVPDKSYTVSGIDPRKNFKFEEHYELTKQSLFPPGSPSLDDIKQSQIPDCFLLAAIQAMLQQQNGDIAIKSMMRQHSDGTTTVRLYDPDTLQPRYFRVQTAKLIDKHGALNSHKALWVHVLENAYAAMGKRSDVENNRAVFRDVDASAASVFSGGGFTWKAMAALTGIGEGEFHYPNEPYIEKKVENTGKPGQYPSDNLIIFNAMQRACANSQMIAAGSSGENKLSGIHTGHAYTVLSVRQDDAGNRWVKLRNPWGSGGMAYIDNPKPGGPRTKHSNDAVFEMDLNDFCESFADVNISQRTNVVFGLDAARAALQEKVGNLRVDANSTLGELLEFQDNYKACESDLLKLEMNNLESVRSNNISHFGKINAIFDSPQSNEQKEQAVIAQLTEVLKTRPAVHMPGDLQQNAQQLYRLAKLDYLTAQRPRNEAAIAEAKKQVVQNAGYEFCQDMKNSKMITDTIAYGFAKDNQAQIDNCQRIIDKITRVGEEILKAGPDAIDPNKAEEIVTAFAQLREAYAQAILEKPYLDNLGVNIDVRQFDEICDSIKKTDQFLAKHQEALNLASTKLEEARRDVYSDITRVIEKKKMTPEQAEHIKLCMALNNQPDNLKKQQELAAELQRSADPDMRDLGEKLGGLAQIGRKLNSIWESIKNLFDGLGFKPNSYNVQAKNESKKEDFCSYKKQFLSDKQAESKLLADAGLELEQDKVAGNEYSAMTKA